MNIEFSKNLEYFQTGIFNILDKKKNEMLAKGRKVYNLSVGTPDFKPEKHIINALIESAKDPENWKYSLGDLDELLEAVSKYYKKRFNVSVTKDEITSVYGSQEGLTHIGFSLCNKGDNKCD